MFSLLYTILQLGWGYIFCISILLTCIHNISRNTFACNCDYVFYNKYRNLTPIKNLIWYKHRPPKIFYSTMYTYRCPSFFVCGFLLLIHLLYIFIPSSYVSGKLAIGLSCPPCAINICLHMGSLLQRWVNLNPNMDKWLHPLLSMGWIYLSIAKPQRLHRWSLGISPHSPSDMLLLIHAEIKVKPC